MDWENDPEMRQMRLEFIESLTARLENLKSCNKMLIQKGGIPEVLQECYFVIHKLAGVATTYQFEVLGKIAESLDDGLDQCLNHSLPMSRRVVPHQVSDFIVFLEEAISSVLRTQKDPIHLRADPRMKDLISWTEALLG